MGGAIGRGVMIADADGTHVRSLSGNTSGAQYRMVHTGSHMGLDCAWDGGTGEIPPAPSSRCWRCSKHERIDLRSMHSV